MHIINNSHRFKPVRIYIYIYLKNLLLISYNTVKYQRIHYNCTRSLLRKHEDIERHTTLLNRKAQCNKDLSTP